MKRRSVRINPDLEERDLKGRYRRQCGSTIYVCNNEENKFIDLKSKKKITAAQYYQLIEKNIISRQTNYICMECFDNGITTTKNENENKIMKQPVESSDEDNYESELTLKCVELGEKLSLLLKDDVYQLYLQNHKVKQIETLNNYQSSEWLLQRPQALILLLCNLCKIDINTAGPSKLNILAKMIELIYYCRNSKLVLPNHLIESLFVTLLQTLSLMQIFWETELLVDRIHI